MSAFADFLDLRTAVVEQVGSERIVDVFPRLVALAEARMSRDLRCRDQITSTTLSFSSGSVSLPSDFAEAIGLFDSNGYEYIQSPLQEVQGTQGGDTLYALTSSTVEMAASDADRTFYYYAKIPTITDSTTDTNWLLAKYPDIYLYGVGAEAFKWLLDIEKANLATTMYRDALQEARANDEGERYSRANVVNRSVTP